MEMGSDIGVPLAGTRLSLWPLPAKQAKEQTAKTQARQVSKRELVFDDLYEQYYARVYAYLRFRVGSTEVAEDLVSQVFERALTHLADLQSTTAAGAWLFRIARNCAIDYFRRMRPAASLDTLLDSSHPRECSPEEVIVAQEERARLLMQLKRLPEREREVIGLKFVACLQNREIARVLNMPEGTVGSLLHRTLARLRAALHDEGEGVNHEREARRS
ncbi:MAG TPA: sigma-70 family RNA polymerase sigma factor [Ktedonobacteraceae bacterium]